MNGDEPMHTPDEWAPLVLAKGPHDHKGHSEEKCVRCGWVMGHQPLNCQNNDTPHVFPSQLAEVERLRAEVERLRALITEWDAACALFAGARPMADPEGFRRLSTREHLAVDALTQEARRER